MDLTAQTATASTVHHPFGSPSGPGLFRVKGLRLPAYIQNVAHALQRSGSARDESTAIQMAVGIVTRWAAGDAGHGKRVHPDVQAAASRALAEWEAAKAAAHSHSNRDGDAVDLSGDLGEAMATSWLELSLVAPSSGGGGKTAAASTKGLPTGAQVNIATGATGPRAKPAGGGKQSGSGGGSSGSLHPHVAAGSPAGGQFAKKGSGSSSSGSTGNASTAKKAAPKKTAAKAPAAKAPASKAAPPKPAAKAKQPGKATAPKMTGKPVPKATSRQQALQQRAGLLKQAAGDRAKVKAVNAQIASLTTAIHAAVKAAAAAKAAAANKKSATATAATAVKKAATTAATTASTTASTTTTAAKATATVSQMRATRTTLRARVVTLKAHAAGLEKQAAAIKLSSGDDGSARFLEMAFAEALTERVPPGKAEGGQFHARTSLTRHDTPEEAARAVNAMSEQQRAAIRTRILPPPGFEWARGDRLAVAS